MILRLLLGLWLCPTIVLQFRSITGSKDAKTLYVNAFLLSSTTNSRIKFTSRAPSSLFAYKKKRDLVTVSDLVKEVSKDTDKLHRLLGGGKKKDGRKRTRQRVDKPRQQYQYASQKNQEKDNSEIFQWWSKVSSTSPAKHYCDWIISDVPGEGEPIYLQSIRLTNDNDDNDDDDSFSDSFAHVLYKPPGWGILTEKKKNKPNNKNNKNDDYASLKFNSKKQNAMKNSGNSKNAKFDDEDVEDSALGFNPNDIWDVLTPEERAELNFDEWQSSLETDTKKSGKRKNPNQKQKQKVEQVPNRVVDQDSGPANILSSQRPSLIAWFKSYMMESEGMQVRGGNHWKAIAGAVDIDDSGLVLIAPRKKMNQQKKDNMSSFLVQSMTYLAVVGNGVNKQTSKKKNIFKDSHEIQILAKLKKGREKDEIQVAQVKLYIGDSIDTTKGSTCDDVIGICQDKFQDGIRGDPMAHPLDRRAARRLLHCQEMELIVTDTNEEGQAEESMITIQNPLMDNDYMPPDIAIYANRRHSHGFSKARGDFLGRESMSQNSFTTAYREINGEGDGLPGWIVDRYGEWLFVQEQQAAPGQPSINRANPLPSIHADHTAGIYHVSTLRDRSIQSNTKPKWIQGQKLPLDNVVKIKENNVIYHVKLGQDWSTGIFLDQRPSRAWLSQHCTDQTRVLNCFAHCGAFSVAAATAGAKTVSLDLESKWLNRIPPQLKDNQVENFDDTQYHDLIYGDCFDWLNRLAKRGEKFDIVILDPPSTSVSNNKKGKKRRWSVKQDMDELVRLASSLIKTGGLLFTTTNSASIPPLKFAKSCQNGLSDTKFKLERIIPMSYDFPSIGPSPVKNLVWRILE